MDSTITPARNRPDDAYAHLLIAVLPLITLAGIAGSACGVAHASLLLYWPVALVGVTTIFAFRPAQAKNARARRS